MRPTLWFATAAYTVNLGALRAAPSPPSPFAFETDVRAGWVQGKQAAGVAVGITPRLRYRFVTLGADVQGATILLRSLASVAVTGGLSVPLGRVRVVALGELGSNAYFGVGANFLANDPGTQVRVPYAGGRGALLVRVLGGPTGRSLWVGLSGEYAEDLYTATQTYTFIQRGDQETNDQERSRTVHVRQSRVAAFVTATFSLPL
jgi:hypothetical protein